MATGMSRSGEQTVQNGNEFGLTWTGRRRGRSVWSNHLFLALIGLSFLLSDSAWSQEVRSESGKLTAKDRQLSSGEYYETFDLPLRAGQKLTADLRSEDFDTFVQINALDANGDPDREQEWFNDDFEGSSSRSLVELEVPSDATYRIMVTTYKANMTGEYDLEISIGAPPSDTGGLVADANDRVEIGLLNRFDSTLEDGEYYDVFEQQLQEGDQVVAELSSQAFDTYLYARSTIDTEFVVYNDDFESDQRRSRIEFTAPATGVYRFYATSYDVGELGEYRLVIHSHGTNDPSAPTTREEIGTLDADDITLTTGEYADVYTIEGAVGQQLRVELTSSEFDTYVMVKSPSGNSLDNDDYEGAKDRSVIETVLTEAGQHRVIVTSYAKGETGEYRLVITTLGGGGVSAEGVLQTGAVVSGSLADDDPLGNEGSPFDAYYFDGAVGMEVHVEMASDAFDSYLNVVLPNGERLSFDDQGNDKNAGFSLTLEQEGRYTIEATTYDTSGRGDYQLSYTAGAPQNVAGRRILGVFVGISDYAGEEGDLPGCADDAQRIYQLLRDEYGMAAEDSVLLQDGDATLANMSQTLQQIGDRAKEDDLLLFFYSGHGGQRQGEASPADPDGIHETLALVDGEMVDDEFAAWINRSPAGIALAVLDACYSGGFAKDVVSARGRMGIFSSEEDVLSQVADQFQAGGYLSVFFAESLSTDRDEADLDSDSQLSAHELSHYLGERYRDDVRSQRMKGGDEAIDPSQDLSFQRLVVDRGGVNAGEILFRW